MNKKNILICIFIFITILSIIIVKPLNDLDEIWNYNTARAVSEGLIPYKDISMITTPLLPIITALFLKIIANELIISRILAAILWTGIIYTTYKILKQLIKEENICLILASLIGILLRDIYCIDYNITVLFIALIILYQEIKNISVQNKKNDILVGILAGLAICTKHSIGAILAFIVVIYKLLFVENKEQFKQYIKIAITRIIGILIPVIILFAYLVITGALQKFINYAILGIKTFSNNIPYISLFYSSKIEIKILSIAVPITIMIIAIALVITKIRKKENKNTSILLTLLIYSLSIIIVMYPISDEIHFLIGSLISIIGLIYIIYMTSKKIYDKIKWKNKYKIYKIITLLIWLIIFSVISAKSIDNIYKFIKVEKNTQIEHYKNIEIQEHLRQRLTNLNEYITEKEKQGKKVYILDAEAAIYMIPLDKYNKDYDMFLKGNIGKDGEQGQIQKIKKSESDVIYLIRKENIRANWQTPTQVVQHIRENLNKIEEIEIYEAYTNR